MPRSFRWIAVASVVALGSAGGGAAQTLLEQTPESELFGLQDPEPEAAALLETVDIVGELLTHRLPNGTPVVDGDLSARAEAALDPPLTRLLRLAPTAYGDTISAMGGPGRPSPREISNEVLSQSGSIPSGGRATDMVWQWGQFLDHDIDLTDAGETEPAPIPVPLGDPFFDPLGDGDKVIPFSRSIFDPVTGIDPANPRQQMNVITSLIDASNVYGADETRSQALRTLDGTGRLEVSAGDLLPFNVDGLPNAGGAERTDLFLAGDVRANEQVGLTAMHTLWVREHNFWAGLVSAAHPALGGDEIYQAARSIVTAEMQAITYREFLPLLLGKNALGPYHGFNSEVDPSIANEFSTAAYRLGHTMLSPSILRLDGSGNPIAEGPIALRDAFFAPAEITSVGIEPYLKGLSSKVMQEIDSKIVDDVRSFLFGPPGAGGLDLASLNIQRGRDHGLPDYNAVRLAYGLDPVAGFDEISSDPTVQTQLESTYGNVHDIDVWVGALAEDHLPGTLVGELLYTVLVEQFTRLRDGDPNWYQNRMSPLAVHGVESQTLAKVIARNTTLRRQDLHPNVFVLPKGKEGK